VEKDRGCSKQEHSTIYSVVTIYLEHPLSFSTSRNTVLSIVLLQLSSVINRIIFQQYSCRIGQRISWQSRFLTPLSTIFQLYHGGHATMGANQHYVEIGCLSRSTKKYTLCQQHLLHFSNKVPESLQNVAIKI
jgi:hypothetical protein